MAIEEEEPYRKPEFSAEVSIDSTGEFAWRLQKASCLTREKAEEALKALQQMPADRRAVWVKRLDVAESVRVCPILRQDKEIAKELEDLVSAYSGAT